MKLGTLSCYALIGLLCVLTDGCHAHDPMASIATSHIEANEPNGKLFGEYLKRDLTSYFCKETKDCRVEFEYLRNGATQSGVSYPTYYLWTKCFTEEKLKTEGAVRVAAIDQSYFTVTDFLSAKDIVASSNGVGRIFPAALVDMIVKKAQH